MTKRAISRFRSLGFRLSAALFATSAAVVSVSAYEPQVRARQSFDLSTLSPPRIVSMDREERLVSELHVSSFTKDPLTLTGVLVLEGVNGRVLGRLEGDSLQRAVSLPGHRSPASAPTLEPGRRLIVYWDVEVVRDASQVTTA